ncbi:MAG: restriction endonuclease subunit S [Clostridium sp.]
MSRLEELIKELCPNGVEYKKIGEIGSVCMCKRIMKHQTNTEGGIPFYKIGTFGREVNAYISKEIYEEYKSKYSYPKKGDILISAAGTIGRTVVFDGNPAYYQDSNIVWVDNDEKYVKNTFLYYIYQMQPWKIQSGGTISRLYNDNILNTLIPIPPMGVQDKIVSLLDNFTELTTELVIELTAELSARRKQYEHYRDELLAFKNKDVQWKTLNEISTEMYRGAGIKRDHVTADGIPCVRYGEIYTSYDISFEKCISYTTESEITSKKYFENGDILFAITGESVEEISKSIAYLGNEKCMAGGDIVVMKHNQNPIYLAYALSTVNAQKQKSKGKVKNKVVHSSVPSLKEIVIPIPSLAEQDRISKILVSMNSLCEDISTSIKSEIEARRKQYEFYRDKLLTFRKLEE